MTIAQGLFRRGITTLDYMAYIKDFQFCDNRIAKFSLQKYISTSMLNHIKR